MNIQKLIGLFGILGGVAGCVFSANAAETPASWKMGAPIVTYWAGPSMTDATAQQMKEGGFNLVWCSEKELDAARRHGLRAQLTDPLLAPASLNDPAKRMQLDALIARVRQHPALYSYFIVDEPSATNFPDLGKLVGYLRTNDPAHLAYINLLPTYANNDQLGCKGDLVTAYKEHLRQFEDVVNPALISYDHYHFSVQGDAGQYFLNLAMIRQAALTANLPFLNIVQACTWTPSMRVPTADEVRFLVYTSLAYGAQGISYYVYCHPGHTGAIANADGTPTALYAPLQIMNRDFAAIAGQLQPLRSHGAYHAGMLPDGAEALPHNAVFKVDPSLAMAKCEPPAPVKGILIGDFCPVNKSGLVLSPTHAVVVNLDYKATASVGIRAAAALESFDPASGQWSPAHTNRVVLQLPPGGGRLVRLANN
jgi:hypothetical protein